MADLDSHFEKTTSFFFPYVFFLLSHLVIVTYDLSFLFPFLIFALQGCGTFSFPFWYFDCLFYFPMWAILFPFLKFYGVLNFQIILLTYFFRSYFPLPLLVPKKCISFFAFYFCEVSFYQKATKSLKVVVYL